MSIDDDIAAEAFHWIGCNLDELCQRAAVDPAFVEQCVEAGIAEVSGLQRSQWRFSAATVLRIRKAWRLHRDLDVQLGSLGLVLDLLEERDLLLQELAVLRQRLRQWEA